MSDIKLFEILSENVVSEVDGGTSNLEKDLQTIFEKNLDTLLGVRFLSTEYSTSNGGRIDTLGIDENGYPVIIEYKRNSSQNIINQGLFYLNWLDDHRAAFEILVREQLGEEVEKTIEWSSPRTICIASDFNKFDIHAVKQMNRNIELIK